MQIFSDEKGILREISQETYALELYIQRLIEDNMKTIFHIDFVASEFELKGLRIDSLGYDEESNSFVIFEHKRDKHPSIIEQGVAYLALMLNNHADFVLKYNERTVKPLKKNEVDWDQSRVIFIAPLFTSHQRKAIEYKDLAIERGKLRNIPTIQSFLTE